MIWWMNDQKWPELKMIWTRNDLRHLGISPCPLMLYQNGLIFNNFVANEFGDSNVSNNVMLVTRFRRWWNFLNFNEMVIIIIGLQHQTVSNNVQHLPPTSIYVDSNFELTPKDEVFIGQRFSYFIHVKEQKLEFSH